MSELILHLPGLEASEPSALPADLTDALRSAGHARHDSGDPLASILDCGPLPAPAALSALAAGVDDVRRRHWLRFDVVRMIPDLTAVWVERPMVLDFDAPAGTALGQELTELIRSEGVAEPVHIAGGFGLIGLSAPPECRFEGLGAAQGGRLDDLLPAGPDAARWRRLITASQMLFHRYRSLDRPDQSGAGLWFWGVGAVDRPPERSPDLRVVDAFGSATLRGLARWLGVDVVTGESRGREQWSKRFLAAVPVEHPDPGRALGALVDDWLQPAMRALRDGRLDRVTIVGSAGVWRLGKMHRFAFWRRAIRGLSQDVRR